MPMWPAFQKLQNPRRRRLRRLGKLRFGNPQMEETMVQMLFLFTWMIFSFKRQITFQEGNSTPCGINTLIHWSNFPSLFSNRKTARGVGDENGPSAEVSNAGGTKLNPSHHPRCWDVSLSNPQNVTWGKFRGWKVEADLLIVEVGKTGVVYHLVMHMFLLGDKLFRSCEMLLKNHEKPQDWGLLPSSFRLAM